MLRKIVKIHWVDASSGNEWTDEGEVKKWGKKNHNCESVGFLIEKNKNNVIIGSMFGEGDYGTFQKIPKGCVKSVKRLYEEKRSTKKSS